MASQEPLPQPEAIKEIGGLEEQPDSGFFGRVQRSVERRRLASDTVDLSWTVFQVMVVEALDVFFQMFGRGDRRNDKGESDE